MSRYMTIPEVAEALRVPVDTLRHWRKVGKGPKGFRLGRRVLFDVADVEAWVAAARDEQNA